MPLRLHWVIFVTHPQGSSFVFIIKFITTQLKTSVQLLKAVNTFGINQNSNSVSIKRAVKLKAVENNTLLETAPSKVT